MENGHQVPFSGKKPRIDSSSVTRKVVVQRAAGGATGGHKWLPPTPLGSTDVDEIRNIPAAVAATTSSPAPYPEEAKRKQFIELLTTDAVILAFHAHDVCFMSSDRYLLAMVFIYFNRSNLSLSEFNRYNFFLALYLSHDVHEENNEDKWEILPWALGKNWQHELKKFHTAKLELLRKMSFKGLVSSNSCFQVFNTPIGAKTFSDYKVFRRSREPDHGGVSKRRYHLTPSRYLPYGPVWNTPPPDTGGGGDGGGSQDIQRTYSQQSRGKPCEICQSQLEEPYKYRALFNVAKEMLKGPFWSGLDLASDVEAEYSGEVGHATVDRTRSPEIVVESHPANVQPTESSEATTAAAEEVKQPDCGQLNLVVVTMEAEAEDETRPIVECPPSIVQESAALETNANTAAKKGPTMPMENGGKENEKGPGNAGVVKKESFKKVAGNRGNKEVVQGVISFKETKPTTARKSGKETTAIKKRESLKKAGNSQGKKKDVGKAPVKRRDSAGNAGNKKAAEAVAVKKRDSLKKAGNAGNKKAPEAVIVKKRESVKAAETMAVKKRESVKAAGNAGNKKEAESTAVKKRDSLKTAGNAGNKKGAETTAVKKKESLKAAGNVGIKKKPETVAGNTLSNKETGVAAVTKRETLGNSGNKNAPETVAVKRRVSQNAPEKRKMEKEPAAGTMAVVKKELSARDSANETEPGVATMAVVKKESVKYAEEIKKEPGAAANAIQKAMENCGKGQEAALIVKCETLEPIAETRMKVEQPMAGTRLKVEPMAGTCAKAEVTLIGDTKPPAVKPITNVDDSDSPVPVLRRFFKHRKRLAAGPTAAPTHEAIKRVKKSIFDSD